MGIGHTYSQIFEHNYSNKVNKPGLIFFGEKYQELSSINSLIFRVIPQFKGKDRYLQLQTNGKLGLVIDA